MSQETIIANSEVSFKDFLFKNKRNRTILWVAAAAIVIQFAVFKYLYPFANYIHGDSFSYLKAAEKNLDVNTYLIGYSKFLRLFSVFNRTDYILTAFQYLFIQSSALYLLFSIFYIYGPRKIIQSILICFIVLNPLSLHLANLISSDGFFLALSFIWVALLLWIIHQPSTKIIAWHAIVLFIAFTVRYNAMIYPAISLLAFMLSKITWQRRIIGLGITFIICGSFVCFTSYKYKKLTGYWQYSPFSGWQFANNAMYTYRYVDSSDRKPVPKNFEKLHNMINEYFDSTRDTKKFLIERIQASTFYMWSPGLPLMKYRNGLYKNDTISSELKKWASMGPLYKSYGIYIILQYPQKFINYFLWPNAKKYYAPPIEFLENYNTGKTYVKNETKDWFGYKSTKISTRMQSKRIWILNYYPILSGIINIVMLCILIFYGILKGWQLTPLLNKGIVLSSAFWFINAGFTIFASSAALRFQSFPIILTTIFVALLLDWMVQMVTNLNLKEHINPNNNKLETDISIA